MSDFDLVIIGGGPGGYAAAVRASRLGMKTALVEKELLGGTCINWGCVPTKALLRYAKLRRSRSGDADGGASVQYKVAHEQCFKIAKERREKLEALLTECQVALFTGRAHLVSSGAVQIHDTGDRLAGKSIIIATGSTPRQIPGVVQGGVNVVTTREAMALSEAPRSAVVVGSGSTGMEFATIWNAFGTKVTVLEIMPNILGTDDTAISLEAAAHFKNAGMEIRTGVTVESVANTAAGVEVIFSDGKGEETLIVEKVLIAAGITPNSDNLGLEALEVEMECGNHVGIDRTMRTNVPGIYAIGDVTGKLPLAFAASEQGTIAVEAIAGHETKDLVYENIPRCIFSDMEVASVGLTEKQARERGYEVATVREPILPSAKLMASSRNSGFIKLIGDKNSQKALGATMWGSDAASQIAIPARMISLGATVPGIVDVVCSGR